MFLLNSIKSESLFPVIPNIINWESIRFFVMPGFGPAAEVLFFREKDQKPVTPSSALLNRADVSYGAVDQLALLGQGPPNYLNVSPFGRAEGVGEEKKELRRYSGIWLRGGEMAYMFFLFHS